MAKRSLTRTDITALATRMERHSVAINIPFAMARDMRYAFQALRHALGMKAFDQPIEIQAFEDPYEKVNDGKKAN